ncbi:MAG: hypothetical protein ACRDTK_18290, partial [Mycobacterium sp.]
VASPVAILTNPGGSVLGVRRGVCGDQAPYVAILTNPGGSVLAPRPTRSGATPRGCDPHQPRRVGAGPIWDPVMASTKWVLRSSPTPEGRCWV